MAKKGKIESNKRKIELVARYREVRTELRERSKNPHLNEEERQEARYRLGKLPKNSAPCRVKNRCYMTGRPRGNLRKFGLSRIKFRELALNGLIPGIKKASW